VRSRAAAWVFIAPLLGVAACADVWGFQDLTASDGGPPDATSMNDARSGAPESGAGDAEADAAEEEGDSGQEVGEDARSDGEAGKAGDSGGVSREGGLSDGGDGGDGAAVIACEGVCMGCCDAQGICHTTTSTTVCGASGTACQDCTTPAHKCTVIGESPCCGTSGCGCAALGIICN
jgi:hypothetical protein